jgi:hypothetical protein
MLGRGGEAETEDHLPAPALLFWCNHEPPILNHHHVLYYHSKKILTIAQINSPFVLAGGRWPVLVCSERKVLLAGCWWLICSEREVLVG